MSPERTADTPTFASDLAAIALHFNPCGYVAPRRNFRRFRQHFSGCRLFTAEVSFDGEYHLDCDWQIAATADNFLWQKEAVINWMVARVPAEYTKIAWIDADLQFLNADWAGQTSQLLDYYATLQLYARVHYLDPAGQLEQSCLGTIFAAQQELNGSQTSGGAWAARRDLLQTHGMYPFSIVGGGDSCWLDAVRGIYDGRATTRRTPRLNAHCQQWMRRVGADAAGSVTYLPGDVVHFYHGTLENRRYGQRYKMLELADYDPEADVRVGANGLLEWCSDKPDLHQQMTAYFQLRAEDEIPVVPEPSATPPQTGTPIRDELARRQTRVILGCYFVTRPDPQRGRCHPGDDLSRVREWAESLARVGCQGVLLVDHETPRISAAFPDLQIVPVPAVPDWTHPNAWRWKVLSDFLEQTTWQAVFITDVFDVQFYRNPFVLLRRLPGRLWIGTEDAIIGDESSATKWLSRRLRKTVGEVPPHLAGRPLLNAGIIGGHVQQVRKLATAMWDLLRDKGAAGESASDMAALNYLVHTRWPANRVWMRGAPLHSRFGRFEKDRDDICIAHK